MGRRVGCPNPKYPKAFVELPDEWLGIHAQRRDEAAEQAEKQGHADTLTQFAVSLSLCDEWRIPGLEGKPENWDFLELPLDMIDWVNSVVLSDFAKAFYVPKVSSSPSPKK